MIDTSTPTIFRYKIEWVGGCVYFLGGSCFSAIGVCMIVSGVRAGWLIAGMFGLIPCLCFLRLLPNCAFLRVSREGVELREWFRSVLFPWDRIKSFDHMNSTPHDFVEMVVAAPDPELTTDAWDRIRIQPVYSAVPLTLANLLSDWKLAITKTTLKA